MSEVSEKVAQIIYTKMANSPLFPYDPKHKRQKPHMKDAALLANTWIPIDENTHMFEIGNDLRKKTHRITISWRTHKPFTMGIAVPDGLLRIKTELPKSVPMENHALGERRSPKEAKRAFPHL